MDKLDASRAKTTSAGSRDLGPGGAVPSEGLHHSGVPLCLANEVAHPFVNAAESHATLMMPGLWPCFCGGKPQEQPKKAIIKFIWAT